MIKAQHARALGFAGKELIFRVVLDVAVPRINIALDALEEKLAQARDDAQR